MSRCLLDGHVETKAHGVGAYAGHTFTVCARCNKPLDPPDRLAAIEQEAKRTAAAIQANAHKIQGDYR